MATPPANPAPAETKKSPARPSAAGQSLHYKLVITLYRIFAITMLYSVLAGILAYAFVMGFYAINSSWAAPVILSASDEKSLAFRAQLVTSQQTIEDVKVDAQKMQSGIAEMSKHRAALLALIPALSDATTIGRLGRRSGRRAAGAPIVCRACRDCWPRSRGRRQVLCSRAGNSARISRW